MVSLRAGWEGAGLSSEPWPEGVPFVVPSCIGLGSDAAEGSGEIDLTPDASLLLPSTSSVLIDPGA